MVDRSGLSCSYNRDMPNGEPAVYKSVTRRVTYLRGGAETVTLRKVPEGFPSNLTTGSARVLSVICPSKVSVGRVRKFFVYYVKHVIRFWHKH